MSVELWGLKNCDTCKKALKWLEAEGVEHSFHDLRKDQPTSERIAHWLEALGSEKLINRRGTTWRKLEAAQQVFAETNAGALSLITEHDALMKRPIWEVSDQVMVGFAKADLEKIQVLLKG